MNVRLGLRLRRLWRRWPLRLWLRPGGLSRTRSGRGLRLVLRLTRLRGLCLARLGLRLSFARLSLSRLSLGRLGLGRAGSRLLRLHLSLTLLIGASTFSSLSLGSPSLGGFLAGLLSGLGPSGLRPGGLGLGSGGGLSRFGALGGGLGACGLRGGRRRGRGGGARRGHRRAGGTLRTAQLGGGDDHRRGGTPGAGR